MPCTLAITNVFQHSDRKARAGTGENLWMGTRGAYSVETMVGNWASERRLFVPGTFPNNSRSGSWDDIGHYTQMIWPTTTARGMRVGVDRDDRLSGLPLLPRRQHRRPNDPGLGIEITVAGPSRLSLELRSSPCSG